MNTVRRLPLSLYILYQLLTSASNFDLCAAGFVVIPFLFIGCCRKNYFFLEFLFFVNYIMPLYIIGLGLGDEQDVTVKGAEAIKKCDRVFLEAYTSILGVSTEKLVSTKLSIFSCR